MDVGGLTWSWDYFFVPQNRPTPDGTGFGMFSLIHLGVLVLMAAAVLALAFAYRSADAERRAQFRMVIGWTVLMLEVLRQTAYLVNGWYSAEILPLHLCAFATYAVFIDCLRPNRWTPDFLYALGWWGALAANLFPDWANRPILNIFTWQSFSIHGLILGYVVMRIVGGDLVPNVRNLWRVAVIAAVAGGGQSEPWHQLLVPQRRRARLSAGADPGLRREPVHPRATGAGPDPVGGALPALDHPRATDEAAAGTGLGSVRIGQFQEAGRDRAAEQ